MNQKIKAMPFKNKRMQRSRDSEDNLFLDIVSQIGPTYTLALTDSDCYILCDNEDPFSVIVPLNSEVSFPIGSVITLEQKGEGLITVSSSATINGNLISAGRYNILVLVKVDTDIWTCIGGVSA